jgi:RsiW-degrading membrane proteinase PrsW (M82 family)
MASAVGGSMSQTISGDDRRLAMIAGAGVTISVAALIARLAGLIATGPATLIVLLGATIGLKVVFSYAAKSASAPSRARILERVSTAGLAISGVSVLVALPHLAAKAGIGTFVSDLIAALWTLTVLAIAAGKVRTLGWRAYVGAGLTGFLGIPALSALVGRPIVEALGTSSLFAVVLFLALRRTAVRPTALDLMLLGAFTGAGFALYENAMYGRGGFNPSAVPLVSLLFPVEMTTSIGAHMAHSGHLIGTALIALGVGLVAFYRTRIPRPELVLLVAFLVPLLEHGLTNGLVATRESGWLADIGLILTLGGVLSSLLLIAGVGYAVYMERRSIGIVDYHLSELLPREWLQLSPTESQRRAKLLARAQQPIARSTPSMPSMQESRV